MKDETGGIAIEEFVELKPRMYSFLVDIKKQKAWIKSYNQYKDVLLNKKCIRHSMNRIQSKDHKIGTHQIKKILLSCFDNKIYIQNNGYDILALDYQVEWKKNSYLDSY